MFLKFNPALNLHLSELKFTELYRKLHSCMWTPNNVWPNKISINKIIELDFIWFDCDGDWDYKYTYSLFLLQLNKCQMQADRNS